MKQGIRILVFGVAIFLLSFGLAQAQGPERAPAEPQGVVAQATVGTSFTYQGQLLDGGAPADGTYDFQFKLFDAQTGGTQVGSTVTLNDVPVSNGLFTVDLDFGEVFDGRALWLEVWVRPGSSTGSYAKLSPRQALNPAPYALSLRPRATISDTLSFTSSGSGAVVTVWESNRSSARLGYQRYQKGIPLSTTFYAGVYGSTDMAANGLTSLAYGVYGLSSATTGFGTGVFGESESTAGRGVYGLSSATTGTGIGVFGVSRSPDGKGVYGYNTAGGFAGYFYGEEDAIGDVDGHVVVIENGATPGGGAGPDGLAIVLRNVSNPGPANNLITFFQQDGPDADSLPDSIGRIEGNGSGGVVYATTGGDFAEMLPAVPGLEPGDVLVVGPDGRLTRSTTAYQTTVVGVYSTAPGFLGDRTGEGNNANEVPLAVVGVVPVKASAENGPIQPGDLLVTANTPGHAMKAGPNPPVGTVIGKALEGLASGTGTILMLVMLQ